MLLLTSSDIRRVFTMEDAVEANRKAFAMLAEDACEIPLRTRLNPAEGTYLVMPVSAPELGGAVKLYTHFDGNRDRGLPTSAAQVMLLDGETGAFLALLDGNTVTRMRTAGVSGLAFSLLGRKQDRIGALIGTGGLGQDQLEAMLCTGNLEQVRVYSRNREKRERFAEQMQALFRQKYEVHITATETAEAAVENADRIITATPATAPVFDGAYVKPGAVISCVGSYQPQMQELHSEVLRRADRIYFDLTSAVLAESGDILKPLEQGIITREDFTGDIGQVLTGKIPGRERDDEIIVFKTVGSAVQDLAAARMIWERAQKAGIGMVWGE